MYPIFVMILVLNEMEVNIENINFYKCAELSVHFVFAIYCILVSYVYKICDNLLRLKKMHPQFYICIAE